MVCIVYAVQLDLLIFHHVTKETITKAIITITKRNTNGKHLKFTKLTCSDLKQIFSNNRSFIIRFTALSFRNPEEFSNIDWRSRITPLRNRREVRSKRLSNGTIVESSNRIDVNNDTARLILPTNHTLTKQNTTDIDIQRMKRETPECVINYNSVRQLLVSCSQSNVIEVKPHCSDDGDEGATNNCVFTKIKPISSTTNNIYIFSTVYNCQGSWTENTTTFIVAIHSGSQHSVCISYQPIDATSIRLFVGDSCYRSMPLQASDHHLAANLTVIGTIQEE